MENKKYTNQMKNIRKWLLLVMSLVINLHASATIQLPNIPSQSEFNRLYEFNTEYAIRVDLNSTYLESGAVVAYVGNQIRGAQTVAETFPLTGDKVYKLRVYSNSASGETVTLRYYDIFDDKIYEITEEINFEADAVPDYNNPQILHAFCPSPVVANLLQPANNAVDTDTRVTFSWEGSSENSHYGLLLWQDGQPEPTTPYLSNITGTSRTVYNLLNGTDYHWRIISYNGCSDEISDTYSFSTRVLPDLTVSDIVTPGTVESASTFNIQYTVENLNTGATVENSWYDAIYVSQDDLFDNNDYYLGRVQQTTPLLGNSTYVGNLDVMLPAEYNGSYRIFVITDVYNNVKETDTDNNRAIDADVLTVNQKSLPDVEVTTINAVETSVQPGDSITINWTVENSTGENAIGGWTEKVSLKTLTGLKVQLSGAPSYSGDLNAGETIVRSMRFKVPNTLPFAGDTHIEVALFPSSGLIEAPGGDTNNNNVSTSTVNIGSQLYINLGTASLVENSTSQLRCQVSRSSNPATSLEVTLSTDVQDQINIPSSVTIPASSYSSIFYLSVNDNEILDGARDIHITAEAAAHNDTTVLFTVYDNEVVSLSATFEETQVTEGDLVDLTITRNLVTDQEVTVDIYSNSSRQWSFDKKATIAANQAYVVVPVTITDDDVAELNADETIKVSSAGMNKTEQTITILDNDVPGIAMEILTDSISESGGPLATWVIISKTDTEDKSVRVRLSTNIPNSLYVKDEVYLPLGVGSKQINLGAVDNGLVDGTRNIVLTGAVYLSSCNCNTTETNGGVVRDTIAVLDNDGPSLSLTFNPLSMAEGRENAGQVTVVRNTSTEEDLTVTLSHNDATELSLPGTVVIPAGEVSVAAPITTINDNVEDGNQQVAVKAEAEGFTPGIGWVFVTDQNKPDLEPLDLTLSKSTVVTGEQVEVRCNILNQGLAQSQVGMEVSVYLSENGLVDDTDEVLGTFTLDASIAPGEFTEFWELVTAPKKTGNYNVLLKVNPNSDFTELVYINNTTSPVEVVLEPNYNGTSVVDEEQFVNPTEITIHGSAVSTEGENMPNEKLDVYLISNNIRQVIEVTTDDSGNYSTTFEPLQGSAGHYIVGACYPDQDVSDVQDEFDILGMKRTGQRYVIWDILYNIDNPGNIALQNLSEVDLTEVVFKADTVPKGFELEIDTIDVLPGAGTAQFTYNIKGTVLTEGNDYVEVPVTLSSAEGIEIGFTIYYYCQSQQGHIKALPSSINTTMTKGASRLYEFRLFNDGAGETGKTAIDIPDFEWMSLLTQDTIPTIASGDTVTVTLQLAPGDDVPLNTPISGNIAVNTDNGNNILIPYRIEAVSEETGNLLVDVVDEYTYYTEEAPHVENAKVVLRHPFSGAIIAEGFTGADGKFEVNDIPEGSYRLYVEAEKHEGYQNIIMIDPGRTNEQTIFLSFQAISYTWEVIRTEIEDEYEVDLVMEFETNVPVPVVTIEMPKEMPALIGDETYTFPVTLTNKGLITANDVELTLPTDDPEYEFLCNYTTMDLLAQQAIQVPVIMQRRDANLKSAASTQSSGNCTDYVVVVYAWECGENGRWQQGNALFSYTGRVCTGTGGGGYGGWGTWGGGGPVRGGGDSDGSSSGDVPTSSVSYDECNPCMVDVGLAILGCYPPTSTGAGIAACIWGFRNGFTWQALADCGIGFINRYSIGCICGVVNAFNSCFPDVGVGTCSNPGGIFSSAQQQMAALSQAAQAGGPSPILVKALNEQLYAYHYFESLDKYTSEIFGDLDWQSKENTSYFLQLMDPYQRDSVMLEAGDITMLKEAMVGSDFTNAEIDAFALRWNRSMEAHRKGIYSPNDEYPDIIDNVYNQELLDKAQEIENYGIENGYESVIDMFAVAKQAMDEQVEKENTSVCATVSIKISQKLTMTREAFEGTLTIFNGNETIPMEEIELNLEVKDEDGILRNDLFEIETKALDILTGIDGTGTLGANETGSATILFIPERGAAPTVPKSYSFGGSFSYLDPFTGTKVTKPLYPVTLDVYPSPDLFLHYFMQRDILGDDALTEDVVEPIVPAELAVMIENNGYGQAKNVNIESAQPEIIDNEKGLAIHFELIGSNLQGEPTQLGLIDIPFGNIEPMTTKIGQWWFTSSLLGHFINYEAKVTHLSSRGNPDLSLVSGAELHELIKSIKVYGSQDDGVNDFLVNEIQDAREIPDAIYISQGQVVLDVEEARNAVMTGLPTSGSTRLFATPDHIGWNYMKIDDPGYGNFTIESVTRVSDGQEIPLDNMWLTHVTLPDGKEPVYEDKLHFVDDFPSMETEEYIVSWSVNQGDAPRIVSITGTPEQMVTDQVSEVTVTFNKPIDANTFDYEDLTLRLQGGADIMDASVAVTAIDAYTFNIDLSTLTTGDGYYVLTVQANEIYDQYGISGTEGKFVSWTQFLGAPAVETFIGLPETLAGPPFNTLELEFNVPVNQATVTPDAIVVSLGGTSVEGDITVSHVSGDTLFLVSGLADMMQVDGAYALTVDLTTIESNAGTYGLIQQTVRWKVDTTLPEIVEIIPMTENGYDRQHYAEMEVKFSEGVTNFTLEQLELWKDDARQPLSQLHLDELDVDRYLLSQFRMLTYYEGDYKLVIHLEEITDSAGLTGAEVYEYTWTVNRENAVPVENLRIAPDLGFSDTDGITSVKELDVIMDVPQNGSHIELYHNDNGTLKLLAERENVAAGELTVPVSLATGGHLTIEAHSFNETGDPAVVSIPVYVDETPLSAEIKGAPEGEALAHPATLTVEFSENILGSTFTTDLVELTLDNVPVPLDGISYTTVSNSIVSIEGLDLLPTVTGTYKLSIDVTQVLKQSSGITGASRATAQWQIKNTNQAPVADAGEDFVVDVSGDYNLDASGSSDPNGDVLTYTWYAPDGFTLDDPNAEMPNFTVPEDMPNGDYTFILSVFDGNLTSTDKVDVQVRLSTDVEQQKSAYNIRVYPNPTTGIVNITGDVNDFDLIKVMDMSGRLVKLIGDADTMPIKVDLRNLNSGIYNVVIVADDAIISEKVVLRP